MSDRETILRIIKAINWQGRYKSIAEQTGFGRPPTEPKGFPDGEPYGVILDYLAWCANGWMGDARLVGNLRAGDIVRAVAEAQQEIARLRKERDSLVSVIENLWQHAEPSIRAEDIREQIACVLSTAGNARREEKPT